MGPTTVSVQPEGIRVYVGRQTSVFGILTSELGSASAAGIAVDIAFLVATFRSISLWRVKPNEDQHSLVDSREVER